MSKNEKLLFLMAAVVALIVVSQKKPAIPIYGPDPEAYGPVYGPGN